MTSKDLIKQILEKWKFPVLQEVENAVAIRFQMSYVQITSLQDDSNGITVTLAGIFCADDERKELIALKACNELNHRMMLVKLYLDEDKDVITAAEFYYKSDDDMEYLLNMALQSVVQAKKNFIRQYKEAEVELNLLQELNNDLDNNSES